MLTDQQQARMQALRVARDTLPPDREISDLIDLAEWVLNGLPADSPVGEQP